MKCRLKSSSAARGVCPSPLAPVRSFGPIKASQISPTIPIRGRSRAAGLRGWFSRKSSTSSFIKAGSSSMASEVTSIETCVVRILDAEAAVSSPPLGRPGDRPSLNVAGTLACITLIAAPNHGHRSRQAAAHIECEELFHVLDLSRVCLPRELLIRFENLTNTSRAYRMAVAN